VALDVLFPEAAGKSSGDGRLIEAVADYPVVLAQAFDLRPRRKPLDRGRLSGAASLQPPPWLPRATGYIANHRALAAAGEAGHITPMLAPDGGIRRLPPLIRYGGKAYPALPVAALGELLGNGELGIASRPGWVGPAHVLTIGPPGSGLHVPMDDRGRSLVPYSGGADRFRYISAADILNGRVEPELLSGVVAFVGSTALGLSDRVVTPLDVLTPGVEVHARFFSGLLDGALPYRPAAAPWVLLAVDLLLAFLAVLFHRRLGPLGGAGAVLGLGALWLVANLGVWRWIGLALPILEPLAVSLLLFASLLLQRLSRAERLHRRLYRQFAAYVPDRVIQRLADTGADPRDLEAERREITVLFADIHHFTRVAEAIPPERLAELMQRVFTELTQVVHDHGGTLDKYMGDALMAFWGAPEPDPDHAGRALAAATEMVERMAALTPVIEAEAGTRVTLGVGINSGTATVGNLGSDFRRAYTALGDPVNIANRLQELTGERQASILVGPGTAAALPGGALERLGTVRLRGRESAVVLYAPAAPAATA
jgi:adenylate cyclase